MRNPTIAIGATVPAPQDGKNPHSRGLAACPRQLAPWRAAAILVAAAVCFGGAARGQLSTAAPQAPTTPLSPMNSASTVNKGIAAPENDTVQRMSAQLALKRNIERQKKMVEDANRLLAMATELKASVDKTTKDVLSIQVLKQADEVERLAKSVKDKMRAE